MNSTQEFEDSGKHLSDEKFWGKFKRFAKKSRFFGCLCSITFILHPLKTRSAS